MTRVDHGTREGHAQHDDDQLVSASKATDAHVLRSLGRVDTLPLRIDVGVPDLPDARMVSPIHNTDGSTSGPELSHWVAITV